MKTIVIPATETIYEGQEFITTSEVLQEGETVQVARGYNGTQGNPIATAKVVMNMSRDPKAPVTRRTATTKASPWRFLWKIKIERIK